MKYGGQAYVTKNQVKLISYENLTLETISLHSAIDR